jgi:Spy/CpxP family protein refolding chaperone
MMNKTVKKLAIVLLALTPIMVVLAFAQTGQGQRGRQDFSRGFQQGERMYQRIPDLSEDQKSEMEKLHLIMMKEALPIRNQLNENRAKYKTLSTGDNVDLKAVNKLIDENAKLQADLKKKAAANHQEVRKLLTDDQRIVFDSRAGQRQGFRKGMKEGQQGQMGQRGQRLRRHAPQYDDN